MVEVWPRVVLQGFPSEITASSSVTAEDNTSGLAVAMDTGGRKLVHWHVELGGAGQAIVQVSDDGSTWLNTANSITLSSAGSWDDWDFIGFKYVRVYVPTTGISVSIRLSAKS